MGVVTVHVIDDADPQQCQDFHCEIKLLTSHMKYFTPFLQHVPGQDVQLSVKCNLQTFGWLMAYVKQGITGVTPVMDSGNCIAILIASNFLKMAQLLQVTVAYIAANFLQLAIAGSVAENMTSLESSLLTTVATAINESCLEALLQQAQRRQHLSARHSSSISNTATAANNSALYSTVEVLVQKMYKYKLEALLKEHQTTLMRCVVCQQLFSVSSHKKLQCPTLAAAATERLKVLPLHQPDPNWQFQDFLQQQRRPRQQQQEREHQIQQKQQQKATSWKDLFWLTWSHVTVLYCQKCNTHFPAKQYTHCSYHPLAAEFKDEVDSGVHPCCGRPAWQPGLPLAECQGCAAVRHQVCCQGQQPRQGIAPQQGKASQQAVTEPNAAARAVELLEHLGNLITVPYTPPPVRSRSQLTPRSRGQTAAAGASGSNGRPSSRESGNKLPLLVRMASRAAPRQAGGASTGSASPRQSLLSPRAAAAAAAGYGADSRTASGSHVGTFLSFIEEEEQQTSNLTNTSSKQQQQGLSSSRRVGNNPDLETDHNISTADNEHDNENASDEYLDYRSAHLSDFLLAVRSSAQSRNRGASLLGMGGMSAARAAAELGVPLQATFSSGGTARRAPPAGGSFRHNTALNSRQGQQLWQRSESSSVRVPGTRGTAPGRPMELHPAAQSSDQASSGSGGKMGGVAAVNRTLLLELMHEDDMYRMGLLMRKLDSVRLQPPPDGVTSSSQPLSAEHVARVVNATLFEGWQAARQR